MIKLWIDAFQGANVEVEGETAKDVLENAALFLDLPKVCPVCGSQLQFFHRAPQTFKYYGLICSGSPRHTANFGQSKTGNALYYEADKPWELAHETYQRKASGPPATEPPKQAGKQANAAASGQVDTVYDDGAKMLRAAKTKEQLVAAWKEVCKFVGCDARGLDYQKRLAPVKDARKVQLT